MKYFKDAQTGEVFGYDETDPTQLPYMQAKIDAGLEDITGSWPLPSSPTPPPAAPTLADLQAQLAALQAQINELAGGN